MRPTIDIYYLTMAFLAATRAGCPKRKVGAIITDHKNRVLSIGYNSPPRDLPTCHEVYCGAEINSSPCISPHAEQSAITSCRDLQTARQIYITCSPCTECTKLILTTEIKHIIFAEEHKTWVHAKDIWTGEVTHYEGFEHEASSLFQKMPYDYCI